MASSTRVPQPHPTITKRYIVVSVLGLLGGLCVLFLSFFSSGVQNVGSLPDVRLQHPIMKMVKGQMIPGNPLYPFHVAKGKIKLLSTEDHAKKVELYIRTAHDRMYAADVLLQYNERGLALTTLSKAESYLGEASREFMEENQGKEPNPERLKNLAGAIDYHLAYMMKIKESLSDEEKSRLDAIQAYTETMRTTLESFFHTSFFKTPSTT